MKLILLLAFALPAVICEECEQLSTKADFDTKQMVGWWYLSANAKTKVASDVANKFKCMMQHWFAKPNGDVYLVQAALPREETRTSEGKSFLSHGIWNATDGNLWIQFWKEGQSISAPLHIIDTDYNNFMIASFCLKQWNVKWIYTRGREEMSAELSKTVENSLQSAKLSMSDFQAYPQTECP